MFGQGERHGRQKHLPGGKFCRPNDGCSITMPQEGLTGKPVNRSRIGMYFALFMIAYTLQVFDPQTAVACREVGNSKPACGL